MGRSQNVDEVAAGTKGAGENVCRACAGSGKVTTPIGGG